MLHETNGSRPKIRGSLPRLTDLLPLTGPLDYQMLSDAYSPGGLQTTVLSEVSLLADEEITFMLLLCLWVLRGRNGILKYGETD